MRISMRLAETEFRANSVTPGAFCFCSDVTSLLFKWKFLERSTAFGTSGAAAKYSEVTRGRYQDCQKYVPARGTAEKGELKKDTAVMG
uniref:Uncharacterized protein n=1 Tax=Setaria digitata TaxID=48799 RepID=A0A915PYR4_9BILA